MTPRLFLKIVYVQSLRVFRGSKILKYGIFATQSNRQTIKLSGLKTTSHVDLEILQDFQFPA